MGNRIEIDGNKWDEYEKLSDIYKEEHSDLGDRNFRNWVLFNMLCNTDKDSQFGVALFEHLKSEGYIVRKEE